MLTPIPVATIADPAAPGGRRYLILIHYPPHRWEVRRAPDPRPEQRPAPWRPADPRDNPAVAITRDADAACAAIDAAADLPDVQWEEMGAAALALVSAAIWPNPARIAGEQYGGIVRPRAAGWDLELQPDPDGTPADLFVARHVAAWLAAAHPELWVQIRATPHGPLTIAARPPSWRDL